MFVYDMHFDKYYPLCVQSVVSKRLARLNHVSFNPSHPLLIVGDSRGEIVSLKLSPNLRRQIKEVKMAVVSKSKDLRKAAITGVKKLGDLLAQVRDIASQQQDIEQYNIHDRESRLCYLYYCFIRRTNTTTNHQIINFSN